jgi:hypothetical protein
MEGIAAVVATANHAAPEFAKIIKGAVHECCSHSLLRFNTREHQPEPLAGTVMHN